MNWQEYQEAVARFYEQADGLGRVERNVYLPDLVTGQQRPIDSLIRLELKGHMFIVLVDAKFRREKLDVKDVEEVLSLAAAVNAHKSIIVTANGWTEPAETKAKFSSIDLRLLTIDKALDLMVEDKWELCPSCENDCIVLLENELMEFDDGTFMLLMAGRCRECNLVNLWCWECGEKLYLSPDTSHQCGCDHHWICSHDRLYHKLAGMTESTEIGR